MVPWRQGFRHPTRKECMGWFAQIPPNLDSRDEWELISSASMPQNLARQSARVMVRWFTHQIGQARAWGWAWKRGLAGPPWPCGGPTEIGPTPWAKRLSLHMQPQPLPLPCCGRPPGPTRYLGTTYILSGLSCAHSISEDRLVGLPHVPPPFLLLVLALSGLASFEEARDVAYATQLMPPDHTKRSV